MKILESDIKYISIPIVDPTNKNVIGGFKVNIKNKIMVSKIKIFRFTTTDKNYVCVGANNLKDAATLMDKHYPNVEYVRVRIVSDDVLVDTETIQPMPTD